MTNRLLLLQLDERDGRVIARVRDERRYIELEVRAQPGDEDPRARVERFLQALTR